MFSQNLNINADLQAHFKVLWGLQALNQLLEACLQPRSNGELALLFSGNNSKKKKNLHPQLTSENMLLSFHQGKYQDK